MRLTQSTILILLVPAASILLACEPGPSESDLTTRVALGIQVTHEAEAAQETKVAEAAQASMTASAPTATSTPKPTRIPSPTPEPTSTPRPTATPPSPTTQPTPTPRVGTTYWSQMSPIVGRWEAYNDDWIAWWSERSNYVVEGYAVEGYWDWLCGRGWFWDRLVAIKEDALALSPPSTYSAFRQAFIELTDAELDADRLKGEICKGDPSAGLIANQERWDAWVEALQRTNSLAQRMRELMP